MFNLIKNVRLKHKFWLLNVWVLAVISALALFSIQQLALATNQPFSSVFIDAAPRFAAVVAILMMFEMAGSQILIRFIERHINRLKDTMVEVQGSGNLSLRASIDARDEIGEMATAFNAMQDRTAEVVRNMKTAIDQLHIEVEELNHEANSRRDELSRQQAGVEHSAAAIATMLESFQGIADRAATASELSQEARNTASQGGQQVSRNRDSIQTLASTIETATANIGALAENNHGISRAVEEIRSIAEQTNLLALNAAIEAARAGEQGRGFAVVADEVRTLAQRVQESTDQIQTTMQLLLKAMDSSITQMTESSKQVSLCVDEANQGRKALDAINDVISRITEANISIAQTSHEQTTSTDAVLNNVHSIHEATQTMVDQLISNAEMCNRLQLLITSLESTADRVSVN